MASQSATLNALQTACRSCSVQQLCLPYGLDMREIEELEELVEKKGPLRKGDHMFRMGQDCQALYAVRSGLAKTYTISRDGEEQVTGFFLAGELVGFDGLAEEKHRCNAKALDTTTYCRIPVEKLDRLTSVLPTLHRQVRRLMGKEISQEEELLRALRHHSAEARLTGFLLRLSNRYAARSMDSRRISLKIPNQDLANYLGLKAETLSRTFTRLEEEGLIRLERRGRQLELLDPDGLFARLPG